MTSRFDSSEERYRNDPAFHRLVDTIYVWICEQHYTPSEVRDAAMLAALKFEYLHMRPMILPADKAGRL